jgi:hypothetical protein
VSTPSCFAPFFMPDQTTGFKPREVREMADPTLGDSTEDMAALIVTADSDDEEQAAVVDDGEDEGDDVEGAETDTGDEAEEEDVTPDKDDELKSLKEQHQAEMKEMKAEINRLGYALRKAEKGADKGKSDDPEFTDAQLLQLMEEHHDEPKVLFQIMKEMQKNTGKSIEKIAENKAKISETRKELLSITEKVMPGALEEGTKLHADVQTSKAYLGLEDHPYGDVLSLAMMSFRNVPKLVQNVKDTMRKELLGKGADKNRKQSIKAESLANKGGKTPAAKKLSDGENETVKRLGLNENQLKYYNKFLKKDAVIQTN